MASWLPETLFEIVGQGPAPSKDYYQLLITRTQASASHGFLSLLTPSPPNRATRWGPLQANSHRGLPEAPRLSSQPEIFPRHLCSAARESVLSPKAGTSLANLPCLPTNAVRSPSCLPASYPLRSLRARRRKTGVPACVPPHLSVGRRERKTQLSVPRRSRQGEKGTVSLPG